MAKRPKPKAPGKARPDKAKPSTKRAPRKCAAAAALPPTAPPQGGNEGTASEKPLPPHDPAAHLAPFRFRPGQSGNPAGRKKGSRNKLSEAFVQTLFANFTEAVEEGGPTKGEETIELLRTTDPAAYVKAIVALAPKHVNVTDDPLAAFDDEEIADVVAAIAVLRAGRGAKTEPEPPASGMTH